MGFTPTNMLIQLTIGRELKIQVKLTMPYTVDAAFIAALPTVGLF
ncbi:hypothetical protein YPPY66_3067 [Yersinia pestis PY-66]|uniref:Uncharacterized protein n=2 Tax=Yersinia pseudotuberculosis complex TaxID=1649845 RepID=A0A0U1R2S2_YERP3|nr:hypothetical protein YpsIP31758_1710 [Yersinia pseudotuberculosis IP 31758]EDR41571.1 hypothetical protein YpE1979001_2707 [Yersinia pestis biovar Antiqua str. E1979001]EDR52434.1 hypothetical protein YpB42003004_1834 [Yersinia pestis biovar Antiqua str. B42003004]EDR65960.1 hypothetical protein YpK1973002_0312 [Yersinia pestis biovar Mediaevalis str. K1973002]EFA49737.1 conserved hypothetical protein [Yersinia pestis KIM D27]EIQ87581.1 hypothetical protein YPPY01_2755 [Yersinia pestis PY-0